MLLTLPRPVQEASLRNVSDTNFFGNELVLNIIFSSVAQDGMRVT